VVLASLGHMMPSSGAQGIRRRSIHRSAWKGNSQKFASTEFSEVQLRSSKFATRMQRKNNAEIVHMSNVSSTWRLLL